MKTKLIENSESASLWWASLQSEKYFTVIQPLRTHDSLSLSKIFIHQIQCLLKPYFSEKIIKKLWSNNQMLLQYPL